jgi:hypothetical protein
MVAEQQWNYRHAEHDTGVHPQPNQARAPITALMTNRPVDNSLRRQFLLSPPAIAESAGMAVKVTVIMSAATSGTP